jgi:hypothetical protein
MAILFGSEYVFNTGATTISSVSYLDSTHFIVAYTDYGNSFYGTAIIGTVSNTNEIVYGDPYVFNSASTGKISVSYLDSTHFVVVYKDNGNSSYGTAIIGTVSNTDEITYGSEYVFNSGSTDFTSVSKIDSTHFVIAYQDSGNSNKGTDIIGTVSNTDEIAYGDPYIFNDAKTEYISCAIIDSTHFVISYQDDANSGHGTAIIGTIANTDEISFGSEYVFNSADTEYVSISKIDSTHFVVAYRDVDNSDYGTACIGTVSNTDEIAYGDEYVFNSGSTAFTSVSYLDSTHFMVSYMDAGNSNKGTSIVGTISNTDEISFGSEYVFNEETTFYVSASILDSTHFVVVYYNAIAEDGTAIIGTTVDFPYIRINIGDTWKTVTEMKINIGDTWKDVDASSSQLNIGDIWKDLAS